ncbi:MAG: helix-turn-helix domain-containing protein [Endozoicomonas sp.]
MTLHHYTECGLSYVYLENGFVQDSIEGEEYVGIDDIDSLHETIGRFVVDKQSTLEGQEVRFLRIEMNMSQKGLGALLGVEDQTIARWEKDQTAIPRTADVLLRSLYLESINRESHIGHLLKVLAESETREAMQDLRLREVENQWQLAA